MDLGFVLFLHTHGHAFSKYVFSRTEGISVCIYQLWSVACYMTCRTYQRASGTFEEKTMAIRNQWPIGMSVRYWSNEMFRLWSSWSLRCLWLTGHERINARLNELLAGWLIQWVHKWVNARGDDRVKEYSKSTTESNNARWQWMNTWNNEEINAWSSERTN